MLYDMHFKAIDRQLIIMTSIHTPAIVISNIIESIWIYMEEHSLTADDLLGIGIGTVGSLDIKNGIIAG